jgi:hypothetical protein
VTRKSRSFTAIAAAAASAALIAVGSAGAPAASYVPATTSAKGPPTGKYQCYQYDPYVGYQYSGWFKLRSGNRYKVFSGGGGKYSVKGSRVKFLSGPYKSYGWYGKYRRDSKGGPVVDLIDKSDPNLKLNCSHAK